MMSQEYSFRSKIYASDVGKGGAYVVFPYDIKEEFGKGRVKVEVLFEDIPYIGSIVNMGLTDENGEVCYIIGIRKDIRLALNKEIGDEILVVLKEWS